MYISCGALPMPFVNVVVKLLQFGLSTLLLVDERIAKIKENRVDERRLDEKRKLPHFLNNGECAHGSSRHTLVKIYLNKLNWTEINNELFPQILNTLFNFFGFQVNNFFLSDVFTKNIFFYLYGVERASQKERQGHSIWLFFFLCSRHFWNSCVALSESDRATHEGWDSHRWHKDSLVR